MASEKVGTSGPASATSGKSTTEKRSIAKQINAQRLDKLDETSQRIVKVLRRTKGALDTCVEACLNGKKPNPEIIDACGLIESAAARIGLS